MKLRSLINLSIPDPYLCHMPQPLAAQISSLPDSPGVYQFFDRTGRLIYIGKAKSLRKRVSSYFHKEHHHSGKTRVMVRQVTEIKSIKVSTEMDALLLENNLIKKHQPKYNVNLRDDKTYPWICITNEPFPRLFYTRRFARDQSEYFGPYTSVRMIETLLAFFSETYKLRTCSYHLSLENIQAGKFKVCLEYQIGNCKGPCEGLQSEADYAGAINEIRQVLKGNISQVIQKMNGEMKQLSATMEFEKAQLLKEKIHQFDKFHRKSIVVNPAVHDADVFSIRSGQGTAVVNYLCVMNGAIVRAHTLEVKKKLDESDAELLELAITELRDRFQSNSSEIIVPFEVPVLWPQVQVTVPKIGDKKKLLQLSDRNLAYYLNEKKLMQEKMNPENKTLRLLEQMKKDLRLKELPRHIECFDNSNFQGEQAVAALTVFKNTRPAKKEYRHFNIKTVQGPDDFASMKEIVARRYRRVLEENMPLPQLIVIDGGKGQLSAAMESLEELGLRGKISIIGIAKKLEEIYYPEDPVPLYIDKKSETLRIIQHIRDEAHRFGISHHRGKRSKALIQSELTGINGIGEKTAADLLTHFKSVKNIKEATLEELSVIIPPSKAQIVFDYFRKSGKAD